MRSPARIGRISLHGDAQVNFVWETHIGEVWINGGFLLFEPEVFNYLEGDHSSLEADAMEGLAADNQLIAYRHEGFWQCMDTMRDMRLLQGLWQSGNAPWTVWE